MVKWVILPTKTSSGVLGKRKRAKGKDEISDRGGAKRTPRMPIRMEVANRKEGHIWQSKIKVFKTLRWCQRRLLRN